MAGIRLEKLELSQNYRSSERIIDYFANYNVYATCIEAASIDKAYPSLVSFNESVNQRWPGR